MAVLGAIFLRNSWQIHREAHGRADGYPLVVVRYTEEALHRALMRQLGCVIELSASPADGASARGTVSAHRETRLGGNTSIRRWWRRVVSVTTGALSSDVGLIAAVQAIGDAPNGSLRAVLRLGFLENHLDVRLDRRFGHIQLTSDGLVRHSTR